MSRPALTVVVACRDRPRLLDQCLTHLAKTLQDDDEVIVVDSASSTPEVAATAERHQARIVRCDRPGASRARNAGGDVAKHDLIAFIDDDVHVQPDWADAISRPFESAAVTFALGRTTFPPGTERTGPTASVFVADLPAVITSPVDNVVGNLAVRAGALQAVGGYDERLGPGTWFQAGEDLDLLDRLIAAGGEGRYLRDALAHHAQWRNEGAALRLQWAYGKGMGARVAAAIRRDAGTGLRLTPRALRLGGIRTALRRLGSSSNEPSSSTAPEVPDTSGWAGPVLWRLGAMVGLLAGLARLSPWRRTQP